jgi:hypothetical protein
MLNNHEYNLPKTRYMTIILTCKRCKGTGLVANEHFEICKALKSDEARRHFHVHAKAERLESDAEEALAAAECGESPTITCPQCNGEGSLEFDDDEWEFTVVPVEDDETDDEGA